MSKLADRVIEVTAQQFNMRPESLRVASRLNARTARVRQIAMYLCHTHLSMSYEAVGGVFGRDRTTVAHACELVEGLRGGEGFDQFICGIEAMLPPAESEAA